MRRWSFILLLACLSAAPSAQARGDAGGGGAAPATAPTTAAASGNDPLLVVFFQKPGCEWCLRVEQALPEILGPYGDRVRVETYNIDKAHALQRLLQYAQQYGVTDDVMVPAVFVGEKALVGRRQAVEQLAPAIADALEAGQATWEPPEPPAGESQQSGQAPTALESYFQRFTPLLVIAAGLGDGINPCAFTTIVFLLSMLAYVGRSRRQILAAGLGFTAGVFVTYLLLGLLLLEAIDSIRAFSVGAGLFRAVSVVVAGAAYLLAGWSLFDYLRYRRSGDASSMTLGLPDAVRRRVNRTIRVGMRTRGLLLGAFVTGCVVAMLESLCTGQVYVPTLLVMARSGQHRTSALGYLVLYNIMFVLPLVAVLLGTYFGLGSERLRDLARSHIGLAKLAMALVFAALGTAVLVSVLL